MSRRPPPPLPTPRPGTRLATALLYELGGQSLPKVVAQGRGTLADKILETAVAHGVAVREDRDLAEMLAVVDVDSDIPTEAMMAVAEILAFLYRANGKMAEHQRRRTAED